MDEEPEGSEPPLLEGDPLLERAVQLYLELRLRKRPPESKPGASRKAKRWLEEEASRLGHPVDPAWSDWLERAFLDVDGDVEEHQARRRHAKRPRPRATTRSP